LTADVACAAVAGRQSQKREGEKLQSLQKGGRHELPDVKSRTIDRLAEGNMETVRKERSIYRLRAKVGMPQDLEFGLTYGQSLAVLERLGFADGITTQTFGYYLKSLRKLGVPFDKLTRHGEKRQVARYNFYHLMELSLVLTLRVYWTLPDAILDHIRIHRDELYRFYRLAFLDADNGRGAPVKVSLSSGERFVIRGLFLDPGIRYAGGKLFDAESPSLLTGSQALRSFGAAFPQSRSDLPLNLSELATRLVNVVKDIGA
jgi:hypothetical protein